MYEDCRVVCRKYLPNHKITVNVEHKGMLREGVFADMVNNRLSTREFEIEIHNRLDPQQYTETLYMSYGIYINTLWVT